MPMPMPMPMSLDQILRSSKGECFETRTNQSRVAMYANCTRNDPTVWNSYNTRVASPIDNACTRPTTQRNATQPDVSSRCHVACWCLQCGTLFGCNEEGRLRRMQSECIGDDQRLVIERDHLLPFEQRKVLVEVNLLHTVSRMTTTMFEGG
jgi:hypothetical protein